MRIKGFTLIELITVLIIVAILAALALPQFAKMIERARGTEAKEGIATIRKIAMGAYMQDSYPVGQIDIAKWVYEQTGLPASVFLTPSCDDDVGWNPNPADFYFQYFVSDTIGTGTITITAVRCGGGTGKPPSWKGSSVFLWMVTDLQAGTSGNIQTNGPY